MAFIPIPNGVQVCFQFTAALQNWQFCLMLRKQSGAPVQADLVSAATIGKDWWNTNLKVRVSDEVTCNRVVATNMTAQGAAQAVVTSGVAGTVAAISAPLNAALVISLRTALRGRSYRGRIYFGGIPVNNLLNATEVIALYASNVLNEFVALSALYAGAGFEQIVASKQHNGVTTNPAVTNPVTAFVCNAQIDSQRRRLFGRGT